MSSRLVLRKTFVYLSPIAFLTSSYFSKPFPFFGPFGRVKTHIKVHCLCSLVHRFSSEQLDCRGFLKTAVTPN